MIALRGVRQLLAGQRVKKGKRAGIFKSKVGAEGSEPMAAMPSTLGETEVSRLDGNIPAPWSLNRETPATAPFGV